MKDRRGHGNQAYLSQTDDDEMMPSKGGYTPTAEDGGSIGAAPQPISSAATSTPDLTEEPADASASANSSAPSAPAPAAETPAMQDQDGSPGYSSQPSSNQSSGASDAPAVPIAEGPAPTSVAGGPGAPASAPAASSGGEASNSYAGDDMGWDAVAFAEAGGYDAVLMGQMPPGMCDGDGGDIFIFVDELNLEVNNTTLIQNTNVNLLADDGSIIEIDGDFEVITTQENIAFDSASDAPGGAPFMPEEPAFIEADAAAAA